MSVAPDGSLDPVVLPCWPSCLNCVSWSDDGELAVAAGEEVHILIPKRLSQKALRPDADIVGHRYWDTRRVKVNVFRQEEWPRQTLEPSLQFSLGQEQSLSTVAALSWSPPGLGPHRRSLLAVLTTNLVLSLWETSGDKSQWRRTSIINSALAQHFGAQRDRSKLSRQKNRIRAFAWAPPFRPQPSETGESWSSKWGQVHLVVATDHDTVLILKVNRVVAGDKVSIHVQPCFHCDISRSYPNTASFSLFQKSMSIKQPAKSATWSALDGGWSQITITYQDHIAVIKVKTMLDDGGQPQIAMQSLEVFQATTSDRVDLLDDTTQGLSLSTQSEMARSEFDSLHGLDGNTMIRQWGVASTLAYSVVCITLHPSDMVEYATASLESCTLLFAPRLHQDTPETGSSNTSELDHLLKVAAWILSADYAPDTTMGRCMLRNVASFAAQRGDERLRIVAAAKLRQQRDYTDEMEVDGAPSDVERCSICDEEIQFDHAECNSARCTEGHYFTRCQLSLLAIQEPGISKFCSQCERQFLKAECLPPGPNGPSLVKALFDEFDVCPYCQAKFCG